jgi:CheY-like chemotaxis protein
VLVVEDDEATRRFLCEQLAADGYAAAGAGGVAEALRAIEVRRPDLVLLDLRLGDGHGLHVLDRVRAADGAAWSTTPTPDLDATRERGRSHNRRGWRIASSARGVNIDAIIALVMALDRAETRPEPARVVG